jgi:hypothetical protein
LGYAVWDSLAFFKQHGPAVAFPAVPDGEFLPPRIDRTDRHAFCEMLRNPIRGFFPFIGTFLLLVAAHGGYFALGLSQETKVMVLGSMVIYMLVALWYFRKLYMFRHRSTDQINIGATFLIGISLLRCVILVLASREIGFIPTLATFAVVGFRHDHGQLHVLLAARRRHVSRRAIRDALLSMNLDTLCFGSAVVGSILTIIGRRLLFHEAESVSDGWRWAVRILPLADIMFLARFWDTAKTGAFTSLIGLGFLLPIGAKTMWDKKHVGPGDYEARGRALDMDSKTTIYLDLKGELDARIEAKQRKLQQLNSHLSAWYSNMNVRRAALPNATPEQLTAFNKEDRRLQGVASSHQG